MLAKNKEVTLSSLKNILKKVSNEEQVLVGARYTSDNLSMDIPIAGVIENFTIDVKNQLASGMLFFRPVAEQVEALQAFRQIMENQWLAVFPDDVTELPQLISDYETDRVASDTIVSNIQEIPMEFDISIPKVYKTEIKIKDKKYTQFVLEEVDNLLVNQTLVLVFVNKTYEGETLFSYWSDTKLTKTEGLKLLQFLANGSVLPSLIASVSVYSEGVLTTTYPLFKDYKLVFFKSEDDTPILRMTCDTGSVLVYESDIKKISTETVGLFTYEVTLEVNRHSTIKILIG